MEVKTIGYGGFYSHDESEMIAELKRHIGDSILIDVRAKPYGAINYHSLRKAIPKYHSVLQFGNTEFSELDMFTIPEEVFEEGMQRLFELVRRHGTNKIILMCSESDANRCHRTIIAHKIKKYMKNKGTELECEIKHLLSPDAKLVDLQKTL